MNAESNSFYLLFLFYLSLTALGLRRCTQAFSSCDEWGLLFVAACGLLIAVASLVAEHGLSSCGAQAQVTCAMWDLPRGEIESMLPALAGGPPGKPYVRF